MFPKPLSTGRWRCNRKLAFGFFLFFTQLIGCMSQPQIPKVNFFLNSKHVPIIWSTLPLEALPSSPPLPIHNGVCHPTWELPQGVVSIRKWRSSTSTGTSAWSGMSFFLNDESWRFFRIFGGCWLLVDRLISTKRHQFFGAKDDGLDLFLGWGVADLVWKMGFDTG